VPIRGGVQSIDITHYFTYFCPVAADVMSGLTNTEGPSEATRNAAQNIHGNYYHVHDILHSINSSSPLSDSSISAQAISSSRKLEERAVLTQNIGMFPPAQPTLLSPLSSGTPVPNNAPLSILSTKPMFPYNLFKDVGVNSSVGASHGIFSDGVPFPNASPHYSHHEQYYHHNHHDHSQIPHAQSSGSANIPLTAPSSGHHNKLYGNVNNYTQGLPMHLAQPYSQSVPLSGTQIGFFQPGTANAYHHQHQQYHRGCMDVIPGDVEIKNMIVSGSSSGSSSNSPASSDSESPLNASSGSRLISVGGFIGGIVGSEQDHYHHSDHYHDFLLETDSDKVGT